MRILIIDNNTKRIHELRRLLAGHEIVEIPVTALVRNMEKDFDLVILTGSTGYPVIGNDARFALEKELISTTQTPLVGICLGLEMIAHTFGGRLLKMENRIEGLTRIRAVDGFSLGNRKEFLVHEGHKWYIEEVPPGFEGIARSDTGWEIIMHKSRPIAGLQFHPEVGDEAHSDGRSLFEAILLRMRNASATATALRKKK